MMSPMERKLLLGVLLALLAVDIVGLTGRAAEATSQTTVELSTMQASLVDETGQESAIDTSIKPDSRHPGFTHSVENKLRVLFSEAGGSATKITLDGYSLSFVPVGTKQARGKFTENRVSYEDLWSGATAVYTVEPSALKEDIVLAGRKSGNVYSYQLHLDGVVPQLRTDGSVMFADSSGQGVFYSPPSYAYDSSSPRRFGRVEVKLRKTEGQFYLDYILDSEWMNNPETVFPVIIDPTVTVSMGQTTYFDITFPQTITWNCSIHGYAEPKEEGSGFIYHNCYFAVYDPSGATIVQKSYGGNGTNNYSGSISAGSGQLGTWKMKIWGAGGGTGNVTFLNVRPPSTSLTSPAAGALLTTSSPTISWSYSDLDGHALIKSEIQLSRDSTFSSGVNAKTVTGAATSTQPLTPLTDGTWYWRVRSQCSAQAWSTWTSSRDFIVDTVAPPAPGVPSVSLGSGASLVINWTAVTDNASGVSHYLLDLGKTAGSADYATVPVTSGTTYTLVPPDNHFLYASVRAVDKVGLIGPRSGSTKLTTTTLTVSATGSPGVTQYFDVSFPQTLSWSCSIQGDRFDDENTFIYIAVFGIYYPDGSRAAYKQMAGPGYGPLVASGTISAGIAQLSPPQWRIRVWGEGGLAGGTGSVVYERNVPPIVSSIFIDGVTQTKDAINNNTPTVRWTVPDSQGNEVWTIQDPQGHEVQSVVARFCGATTFNSPSAGPGIGLVRPEVALPDGRWAVQVQAKDTWGATSSWLPSQALSFIVDTTPPPSPASVSVTPLGGGRYAYSWAAVNDVPAGPGVEASGVVGYRLSIGTSPNSSDIRSNELVAGTSLTVETGPEGVEPYFYIQTEDEAGNRSELVSRGPDRTVQSFWEYDNAGNRTKQTRIVRGIGTQSTYTHNELNQLTQVVEGPQTVAFEYDANGNLTKKTDSATSGTEVWEYVYDGLNQLTAVKKDGVVLAAYAYDTQGRRVKAASNGKLTIFIYSGIEVIYEETYDAPGTPDEALNMSLTGLPVSSAEYARANGQLVAKIVPGIDPTGHLQGEVATYYHQDHLGSTRVMTDSEGKVVARMDYEPFGAYLDMTYSGDRNTIADDEHFGYTGQRNEDGTDQKTGSDIGLYYYGARFYDPAMGRFITQDTFTNLPDDERGTVVGENPSGFNRYTYALNNPVVFVDPDGKQATATVAAGMSWLLFVDGPLPAGDVLYGVTVGGAALQEYGPLLLDKFPGIVDTAESLVNRFSESGRNKDQVEGFVNGPLREHLDKLAGRHPGNYGNPQDPRNRNDWAKHAKKAWTNIVKRLQKLKKPLDQVLRERGWSKESVDKLLQDMGKSGVEFDNMDQFTGGGS